jgi:hypothetical protein
MHKVQPNAVNTTSDRPTDFRRQHHAHSRSRFGVNNLKIWIKKEMKVHFSIAICIDSVAFWKTRHATTRPKNMVSKNKTRKKWLQRPAGPFS